MKNEEQYCIPVGDAEISATFYPKKREEWWAPSFYHFIHQLELPKMRWVLEDESGLRERRH